MAEFKLPELGEDIHEAEVIRLLVAEGDVVKADQNVMEVESAKATAALPCSLAGTISKIHVKEGDTIKVGQTLLTLEEHAAATKGARPDKPPAKEGKSPADEDEEDVDEQRAEHNGKARSSSQENSGADQEEMAPAAQAKSKPRSEVDKDEAEAKPRTTPAKQKDPEKESEAEDTAAARAPEPPLPAGPATRRLAREKGIALQDLEGTGPGGRITPKDVEQAADRQHAPSSEAPAPLPDFSRWGPVQRTRLSKLARTAADRLSLSWRTIPHVTQHEVADLTELEAARSRHNSSRPEGQPKITLTALALKALVAALRVHPQFNASLDLAHGELILKQYYHFGVAVDTEQGLLVPVIRDVDGKSITTLAAEVAGLADKARQRALSAEEMQGATFTLSNQGAMGGGHFTPIINLPEVAILGLGRARWGRIDRRPDDRLLLPLSLSYDHRALNGAAAARFISKLAELLSDTFLLLSEA